MKHAEDLTGTASLETSRVERFMVAVYAWMAAGIAVTAATAYFIAETTDAAVLMGRNPLAFVALLVVEVLLATVVGSRVRRLSSFAAGVIFILYAFLNGVTLSMVLLATTATSLTQAFLTVSGMFLAMTTFGLCTKKSLEGWDAFLFMGLIGVVAASLLNIVLGSPGMQWVVSLASVVVFSGLTACDTQALRLAAREDAGGATPIQGALALYLDFVNLMLALLRLLGNSSE